MPRTFPQSITSSANLSARSHPGRRIDQRLRKIVAERGPREGWFDVSTLKEPYRIEGKKTMGYEFAEQFNGSCPKRSSTPPGAAWAWSGCGKPLPKWSAGLDRTGAPEDDLRPGGRVPADRPGLRTGGERSEFWQNAATVSSGPRVPKPLGDFLVLQAVRESGGTAVRSVMRSSWMPDLNWRPGKVSSWPRRRALVSQLFGNYWPVGSETGSAYRYI